MPLHALEQIFLELFITGQLFRRHLTFYLLKELFIDFFNLGPVLFEQITHCGKVFIQNAVYFSFLLVSQLNIFAEISG